MAAFLLDSSFCIACLRRKAWALRALASVHASSVAISPMALGELLLGAELSADPAGERVKVEAFIQGLKVLPSGDAEAAEWAAIDADLGRKGCRIETEDALQAATALARGLILVTGNRKPFERVAGLEAVDWEARPPAGGGA